MEGRHNQPDKTRSSRHVDGASRGIQCVRLSMHTTHVPFVRGSGGLHTGLIRYLLLLLNVLLQPSQPLLRLLQHLIVFAHREPQPVFDNVSIRIREELGWRDSSNPQLLDKEPAQLEVSRSAGNMRREFVVLKEVSHGRKH